MPGFSRTVAIDIDRPIGKGSRGVAEENIGLIKLDNRGPSSVTVTVTMLAPIARSKGGIFPLR
jgi:hypothetical protein